MVPHKIGAKLFFAPEYGPDLAAFIPVFHHWIREQTVRGLLIDVVDYKHVPNGPGVVLIGHEGDYSIDLADGRPGLRYIQKRGWNATGSNDAEIFKARILTVLNHLHEGAEALRAEETLIPTISFTPDEIQVSLVDQLKIPNTPENAQRAKSVLLAAIGVQNPGATLSVTSEYSGRGLLTYQIQIGKRVRQPA